MDIPQTTPIDAHETLIGDTDAVYLDVRSSREFAAGHPEGALNIPIAESDGGGPLSPNPDFLAVVERHLVPGRPILVGCQSGGRSQRACGVLLQAGYTNVTNVQGGFGGARDRSGQEVTKGWQDCGLPVAEGSPEGRCYRSLKQG
jgi:rhodanese-related sulfurtransferase